MKSIIVSAAMVGAGGFIGAICRYGMSTLVQRGLPNSAFPYGTLAVNMLGCLLIGLAIGYAESRQVFGDEFRRFVLVGILGGFTTYSTFGYETMALLQNSDFIRAFVNVSVHVAVGLFLVWLGIIIVERGI